MLGLPSLCFGHLLSVVGSVVPPLGLFCVPLLVCRVLVALIFLVWWYVWVGHSVDYSLLLGVGRVVLSAD